MSKFCRIFAKFPFFAIILSGFLTLKNIEIDIQQLA